jgi:hypothetical protein
MYTVRDAVGFPEDAEIFKKKTGKIIKEKQLFL